MRTRQFTLILLMLLGTCLLGCSISRKDKRKAIVNDTNALIDAALKTLGLNGRQGLSVSVAELQIAKILPSVAPLQCKTVRIENMLWVNLSENSELLTNRYIHSIDVLFDQSSGQPVRIESVWPVGVAGTRFPSFETYEKQLKHTGQVIVGIPKSPPKISLQNAMRYAMGFSTAKQIIVYYALESYPERGVPPRAVWIIHVWGCAPVPLSGPPPYYAQTSQKRHEDALNHLRTIVDAETGKYYGSDSIPQPE